MTFIFGHISYHLDLIRKRSSSPLKFPFPTTIFKIELRLRFLVSRMHFRMTCISETNQYTGCFIKIGLFSYINTNGINMGKRAYFCETRCIILLKFLYYKQDLRLKKILIHFFLKWYILFFFFTNQRYTDE